MLINDTLIIEKAKELEEFNGDIPKFIAIYIDTEKWKENLISKGLWGEVESKITESKHNSFEDDLLEFIQWVEDNPQYRDFIIEE